jgi:fibronectin-binding autotransporter adhesin
VVNRRKRFSFRIMSAAGWITAGMWGAQHAANAAVYFTGADSATPTNWNDKTNWSTMNVPGGTNTILFYDAGDLNLSNAAITITTSNAAAVQLQLGNTSGQLLTDSFSINSSSGKLLTLAANASGSNPIGITRNAAGTQIINANVALGKSQIWDLAGGGSLIVNGIISDGGSGYGINKQSSGTLELSNANTFSGQFSLQGGTVILDNSQSLGTDTTDPVLLSALTSTSNASLFLSNNVNLTNNLVVQANQNASSISINIGGATTLTGTASFTGGITLNQGVQLAVPASATLNVSGIIRDGTVTGDAVAKINPGLLNLSGANTFTGGFTARGGTTIVGNNQSLGTLSSAQVSGTSSTSPALLLTSNGITLPQNITVVSNVNSTSTQYGATLGGAPAQTASTWTGNIILNQPVNLTAGGAGTVTFSGNISDGIGGQNSTGTVYNFSGSNITKSDAGTVILSGSNTYSGSTNISGGTLILASPFALSPETNLIVGAGASVITNTSGGVTVNSLNLAGTFDLKNSVLVVENSTLTAVNALVSAGFNGGAWNGTSGIISSTAAADTTHLTTLGIIQNSSNQSAGSVLKNTMDAQSGLTNTDILVKYTYYGDANLDGQVDGSDYSLIDNGYLNHLTGWYNGDFNYDGVVDGSDYTLIDNAFNSQGVSLASAVATAQLAGSGPSAVPEPAALSLIGVASLAVLLGRRGRSFLE